MVVLRFVDSHNQVAFLKKTEVKDGQIFHEIVDFLNHSYIRYALTVNPTIYSSHIKQFWRTGTALTLYEDDEDTPIPALSATVDGQVVYVIEKSLRRHLRLDESDGTLDMPNPEILAAISQIGYDTSNNLLTFNKVCFSP